MAFERLVALQVVDDAAYDQYRAAMKPILSRYGGYFGADFKVRETLLPSNKPELNRVFTIGASSQSSLEAFFADPDYKTVRAQFFDAAVTTVVELARYEVSSADAL